MLKTEYMTPDFKLTYTLEEEPPHPTIPYGYYDETYAITVIFQGKGTCTVEGKSYPLQGGDMMLLSPDEIRCFQFDGVGAHERLSLYFSDAVLLPLLDYDLPLLQLFRKSALGIDNKHSFDPTAKDGATLILDDIKRTLQAENTPFHTAKLHILILQLLLWLYGESKPSQEGQHPKGDSSVWEICQYVKGHLDGDLSYEVLQRALLVSHYQLTEVFSRHMGITLTEYVIRKRLGYVISLVMQGEGIESAAYRAGFGTYSNFYKKFVKLYHTSPKLFFKGAAKKHRL